MKRITRRTFIGQTAAAAAPAFVPATVLGRAGRPAPSEQLSLAIIGCGTMGYNHLKRFLRNKDVRITAVCDVAEARRVFHKRQVDKAYKTPKDSKGCPAYNDYREVIGRDDIDAVLIATPDHWHAAPIIEACKAKKDIYCEKPLTLTIHEAKTVIDAVRKYERVFQTGSQQRSSREFRQACELIRNGRIGKLERVEVGVGGPSKPCDLKEEEMEPGLDWDLWLGQAPMRPYNSVLAPRGVHTHFPAWRHYKEYSGGMMTDWGAHHFDITQWALGMDKSGPVEIIPPENPAKGKGVKYRYDNGVEVVHGGRGGITFFGTKGKVFVTRGKLETDPKELAGEKIGEKEIHLYKSPGHHQDWLNCIKSRKQPICDVEVGARSVTVCHLGNLAYWTGKTLKWDPKNWTFKDEADNKLKDREQRDKYKLPSIS